MRHGMLIVFMIFSSSLWALSDNTATPPPAVKLNPDNPAPPPTLHEPTDRGQLLYEHHCTSCHTSVAHLREHRKAKNRADITVWATKWAVYQKLSWSSDDIHAVVEYLDTTFYKFSSSK
jgi:mono/diheme cytochrome c family protein